MFPRNCPLLPPVPCTVSLPSLSIPPATTTITIFIPSPPSTNVSISPLLPLIPYTVSLPHLPIPPPATTIITIFIPFPLLYMFLRNCPLLPPIPYTVSLPSLSATATIPMTTPPHSPPLLTRLIILCYPTRCHLLPLTSHVNLRCSN